MTDETAIALGGGAYLGGLCGGALALAAPAGTVGTPAGPLPSPLGPAAVGAIAGLLLGAALARRRLSAADVRALVEAKPRVLATMVPVIVLLVAGVAFWGEGARFWLGLAGVFLAEIGWATVVQTGQNESSAAAIDRSDAVTTLPETQAAPGMSGFLPDLGPLRRVLRAAGALALVAVGGYAWLRRDPFLLVLALPAVALVLPPLSPRPTRVTDRGLVFEQGLGPVGSLGTKLVEWDAFEGYALEDDRLRIAYDGVWSDLEYDRDRIDDLDRAAAVLDRNLPRLDA